MSEAQVIEEGIQRVIDAGIELIEVCASVGGKVGVMPDRLENSGSEWRVDAMGELEEQDADTHALWRDPVGLGLRYFDDEVLGAELGQVVAQLGQAVRVGGQSERLGRPLVEVAGPERPPRATWAKHVSACMTASKRGSSSLRPGVRRPLAVMVGSRRRASCPRST